MDDYKSVSDSLRRSYDGGVAFRESHGIQPWKQAERESFLHRLKDEGLSKLLEVGAGTGVHGKYFQDAGLEVVSTDLSPAMVEACRAKGLEAYERDFLNLGFEQGSFDAVFALNCLLHVPHAEIEAVVESLRRVLQPGGLLYLGQYGGEDREGFSNEKDYDPPRFFAQFTDKQLLDVAARHFEVESFNVIPVDESGAFHFQALLLRRLP